MEYRKGMLKIRLKGTLIKSDKNAGVWAVKKKVGVYKALHKYALRT